MQSSRLLDNLLKCCPEAHRQHILHPNRYARKLVVTLHIDLSNIIDSQLQTMLMG